MFLSPIFFASIGLEIKLPHMSLNIVLFSIFLFIVSVITKIVGCGLGAKLCHYSNKESLEIGTGMISKGEVALVVANKGAAIGLLNAVVFGPIIIMIVATTIITPILLKLVFQKDKNIETIQSDLIDSYEETAQVDEIEQEILDADKKGRK